MELQVVIKEGIDHWLSRRPKKRSIHSLAKKSGVKYSTLINVYNSVINPPIEKLVPVLLLIFGSMKTKKIISDHHPSLLEAFSQILGAEDSISHEDDDALYSLLEKKEYFVTYLLCITTGAKKDEIARLYGNSYLKALKDLYELNLVEYNSGRYLAKKSFVSFPSIRKTLSFIPHFLSIFDEENVSKGGCAYMFAENISAADLNQIAKLQDRYHKELKMILDNSDDRGDLCWFGANFANFVNPNYIEEIDI